MKLKKWLSRALVLAMVVALMIPVPVAAKSSSGGKLVKSVTYYTPENGGGWRVASKVSYKYGNKKMPTEITTTGYNSYFLGVPVSGWKTTDKIKYKGKTSKTYDSAGFLFEKATYKNGKVVSWSREEKSSTKQEQPNGTYTDYAKFEAEVGHATYFKNGLTKASDTTTTKQESDGSASTEVLNTVYAWTQSKGVPSAVVTTSVWNDVFNGKAAEYNGQPFSEYAVFNAKGLALEFGDVEEGKNVPEYAVQYTMKKGKVASAVIYKIGEKGVPTPVSMMKFTYTKTSVSKAKYFNMINSFVDYADELPGNFNWF